jgi:peptidoglycan DL-endopeptidase CwlO
VSPHRKAKDPVRTALSITVGTAAAAAGVGLTPAASHAASVSDVQAQVAALDAQAEKATNQYDAATEQLAILQKQVDAIQGEAATTQQSINTLLDTLGPMAAAQYRAGSVDPTLELMLSSSPDSYLSQAATMSQVGRNTALRLKSLETQQAQLTTLKKQAAGRLAQLQQAETQAASAKAEIVAKVRQAQGLLAQLTHAQQQAVAATTAVYGVTAAQIAAIPPATGRAATAIAFAKSKLGMWYQWGGTGNPSYDCSGLTQAAWAAAGVSLGRTTYDQVTDGHAVPAVLADLQPGDLIFYNNNEHMAIYLGNSVVIHAPTTGEQISYAPWNMLPIDAVRRVI